MALVEVSQGYIKGGKTTTDSGVSYYEFLCIPYAKPPVGNLRFKSPEPPEKWDGVLDVTEYKEDKVCVQIILENNSSCIGNEDCLYLNVYTPKLPESDSKLLPVMVFIHGGGFVRGNEKMGYTGSTKDKKAILEFLVASPINQLSNKAGEVDFESICARGAFEFIPTIEKNLGDGKQMLTEHPYKLIKDGQFNRVPTMMGVCEKEGYFLELIKPDSFRDISENKNFADYLPYKLEEGYKDAVNKHFLSVYSMNLTDANDDNKLAVDFFGDLDFVAGCYLRGDTMARKGVPVYFYEFHYDGNINHCKIFFNIKKEGSTHGDDWTYIFEHDPVSKSADEKDESVREIVTKLWTNFAKTSDPTPNDDLNIRWPSYNTSKSCLIIDEKPEIKSNYLSNKIDVFTKMYNIAN
ncbi:carboxylesterase [Danaus plexippus plexippus]|uniref:Carboxylesterase n=1 Tax=Danaus plexippus plexippus TaxID=278856 RepID=A0A212EUA8_DANPL|nr:carboxylesterase [Danaus plexippus plexippus]